MLRPSDWADHMSAANALSKVRFAAWNLPIEIQQAIDSRGKGNIEKLIIGHNSWEVK